jgi:FKBP-type peptidyl-prolyl cis-trans isomerase FklB
MSSDNPATEPKIESHEQKVSYGIGLQMADQLLGNSFEGLEIELVIHGLRDLANNSEKRVSNEDLSQSFQIISERQQALAAEQSEKAAELGKLFLIDNAKRDDVTETSTGLQYEVISEGSGEIPTANSTVRVHYHGMLIDSTVFDSSVERDEPAEFPVGGVISGWTEALQLMPVGAKWRLFIPHDLAYGERGAGAAIPPYSALILDVELLEIL